MADLPAPYEGRPTRIEAAETPGLHSLLGVAVGVVVVAGLYFGRSVLIPITLAALLSFVLAPMVNLLRRAHLGRVPSVILVVVLAVAVILAVGGLIGSQMVGLADAVPRYASTIQQKVDATQQFVLGRITGLTRMLRHTEPPHAETPPAKPRQGALATPTPEPPKPLPVEVQNSGPSAVQLAGSILSPVIEPLSTTAIVVIVTLFILLQREDLRDRLIRLFGSSDLHRTTIAMDEAGHRLSRYFLAQCAINAAFGVIIATGLTFIGIPSPITWGMLSALLRFVPYIGSPLSAVIPLALAAAVDPGWTSLLWTAALYLVSEPIVGQLVEPLLYGHSTGLSPFSVVVAAIFWTWLWGPIGLLLSTPLTLCLVVLGRHVPRLQFLDVLLGDRPALTPVESFYQRMLAGDPDEAHDQAELLLKEQSLGAYYDDVALKGLQLATIDAERGVLTSAHLERIKQAIYSLIEELDDHEDLPPESETAPASPVDSNQDAADRAVAEKPAPKHSAASPEVSETQAGTPVLCIAGRGLLDEVASTMLAQLLRRQGLSPRVVPHVATGRSTIGTLDVSGVAIVCISYLELSGSPSHLRYLLRRLRQRLPRNVPLLVGLWPAGEEVLQDERLRTAVGADYYTSSLQEALALCMDVARQASPETRPVAVMEEPAAML